MKVLFAVSSESISDAIIKRYQKEYKEILSYKNVYYFNAILKEIQKDKTYDRIIISEDLEPFSNNNYDTIDKFIFEKLDNISDEAQDSEGKETSIILICTDRHTKGSSFLVKLFGIGVYNALLGNDRSMESVCRLINKPRVKKEAKLYYKIDSDDVSYDPKSEKEVSELEIQNILTHFKKNAKNKEKFADSFNNIASQYTDEQLKIIINCLPINVKAVLEEESPKYQEIMSASGGTLQRVSKAGMDIQEAKNKTGIKIDILENKNNQTRMSGPIVIPSSVKTSKNKGPMGARPMGNPIEQPVKNVKPVETKKIVNTPEIKQVAQEDDDLLLGLEDIEETVQAATKQVPVKPEKKLSPSMFVDDNEEDDSLLLDFDEEDTTTNDLDMNSEIEDVDEFIPNVEDEDFDDFLPGMEIEEDGSDDLSLGIEDEEESDDLSLGLEMEEETDDLSLGIEDEEESDDLSLGLEMEEESDDLSLGFEMEEETDDLSLGIENEEESDDLLLGLETEETDEILPEMFNDNSQDENIDDLIPGLSEEKEISEEPQVVKKGRGRPRKYPVQTFVKPKGKRGRPRKNQPEQVEEVEDDSLLMNFDEDESLDILSDNSDTVKEVVSNEVEETDDLSLGFEMEEETDDLSLGIENEEETDDLLLDFETDETEETDDLSLGVENEEESNDLLLGLENEESSEEILDGEEYEEIEEIEEIEEYEELEEVVEDENTVLDYEEDSEEEFTEEATIPGIDELDDLEEYEEDSMLPGMEEEYEEVDQDDYLLPGLEFNQEESAEEDSLLLDLEDDMTDVGNVSQPDLQDNYEEPILNNSNNYSSNTTNQVDSIKPQVDYSMSSLNSLLTKDKKIVTFLGTTKNGTSFLINNLAALFSSLGINTAILDMTKNRNSYYIYTKNEEELRKIAYTSIEKLQNGFSEGIKVDKNLTVYTALPNDGKDYSNAEPILSTLVQNHSLVLIDCDFDTDPSYFASCQEIYLVQSMDILTIQPLTSFLRDLKAQGVLESEKVRVVVNKETRVRSLTIKMIIGGMSFYNDPAMSFMTELFNKDMVKACSIPFEESAYSKYLDAMVNCNVSLSGYSKAFLSKLRILGDMVYPLTSKQTYSKPTQGYAKNAFSNSINNTLNQMKNKY